MSEQVNPSGEVQKGKPEEKVQAKPKSDWQKKAEQKKLKKQQDREKQKTKVKQPKEAKPTKAPDSKPQSKQEKPKPVPAQQKPTDALEPISKQVSLQATPIPNSIQQMLPERKYKFRTRESEVKNILLSYTPQLVNQQDTTLLVSTHQLVRQWSDLNIGGVVDIWNLTAKSYMRQNIIRTRFEDVSYFTNTITKAICGASAVFQNGVVMSTPGTLYLAVLAKEFGIPFIVLAPSHKYHNIPVLEGDYSEYQGVLYDIIPSKYISLMVTEAGPIDVCSIETLFRQLHPSK